MSEREQVMEEWVGEKERRVCESMRLYPIQYMAIKNRLIRESVRSNAKMKKQKVWRGRRKRGIGKAEM